MSLIDITSSTLSLITYLCFSSTPAGGNLPSCLLFNWGLQLLLLFDCPQMVVVG
jgi:hypothetical protein